MGGAIKQRHPHRAPMLDLFSAPAGTSGGIRTHKPI